MEIHQVLVSAAPFDAICNAAMEVRSLLRRVGRSEIFAYHLHPDLEGDILPLRRYERYRPVASPDDLLIFHASIGEPPVFQFLMERPERLVVMYHNISPAEPFMPFDPGFAGLLQGGRAELAALRDRTTMAIAVSEYNAGELRDAGFRDVRVAPLIIEPGRLSSVGRDPWIEEWLAGLPEGPSFLFVGQFLPHKRPDHLVQAFQILSTHLLPEAHLFLVGTGRLAAYYQALVTFTRELSLHRVHFLGSVTDAQLGSIFTATDTFVTSSEHEGFCVPLIEAMAFGVPVIARAHAAIPETVDDAALLLPAGSSPELLAEAMAELATDDELRKALIDRGRRRVEHYNPDRARSLMLDHLLSVA